MKKHKKINLADYQRKGAKPAELADYRKKGDKKRAKMAEVYKDNKPVELLDIKGF